MVPTESEAVRDKLLLPAADQAKVEPTRIGFVYALSLVCREWQRANAPRAAIGNIPRDLATLRLNLKRLVLLAGC